MPIRMYRDKDGNLFEEIHHSFDEAEAWEKKALGGGIERAMDEEGKGPIRSTDSMWPIYSDAAGVHPDQVKEAEAHACRNGVPTNFTPDGRCVFRSRKHRKEYCKLIKLRDRDGGYGDA